MLRLGWFSSGRGPGSRNLLRTVMDGIQKGGLDAEISFVFCNWDNTETPNSRREERRQFFDLVKSYDIPLVTESFRNFNPELREMDPSAWSDEYGRLMREAISDYPMDLGILAGYMLWLDPETCSAYDILNLHPALPDGPKGTWQDVIWDLIGSQASEHGAMMHLCTKDHDRGPPVTFCRFPIRGGEYDHLWSDMEAKLEENSLSHIRLQEGEGEPLFKRIRSDGAARELPLMVSTIELFSTGEVSIRDGSLWRGDRRLDGPYDLTNRVDEAVCRDGHD